MRSKNEVYRFICLACPHHWWSKLKEPQSCPYCGSKNTIRVFFQYELATMELDRLSAVEEKIVAVQERDEARRWARHFYRLWKATQRTVASKGRKAKGAK